MFPTQETLIRFAADVVVILIVVGLVYAYFEKRFNQLKERVDFIYYPKMELEEFEAGTRIIVHKVEPAKRVAVIEKETDYNLGMTNPELHAKIRLVDYRHVASLSKGKRYSVEEYDDTKYFLQEAPLYVQKYFEI
jgi:hypothetical protein